MTDVHVVKSVIDKPAVPKTEGKSAESNDGNAAASVVSEEDYAKSVKDIEDEAVRVVRLMKPWEPGKRNGAPVRVRFYVPLTFRLN